jgi:hypothetical protein
VKILRGNPAPVRVATAREAAKLPPMATNAETAIMTGGAHAG